MKAFRPLSVVEQLAAHLRGEILSGALNGSMPGVHQLRETLGTSPQTVMGALKMLEHQGLLESHGPGRRSRIVIPEGARPPGLRVEILLYEKSDLSQEHVTEVKHELLEAGHMARFSQQSLLDLGMDVKRLARYVEKTETDAWVVMAGSKPYWSGSQPDRCRHWRCSAACRMCRRWPVSYRKKKPPWLRQCGGWRYWAIGASC